MRHAAFTTKSGQAGRIFPTLYSPDSSWFIRPLHSRWRGGGAYLRGFTSAIRHEINNRYLRFIRVVDVPQTSETSNALVFGFITSPVGSHGSGTFTDCIWMKDSFTFNWNHTCEKSGNKISLLFGHSDPSSSARGSKFKVHCYDKVVCPNSMHRT